MKILLLLLDHKVIDVIAVLRLNGRDELLTNRAGKAIVETG